MELIWIAVFSISIAVIIVILYLIEKRFKKELKLTKTSPKRVYSIKLSQLKKSNKNYKEKFSELSKIAGKYFRSKLELNSNSGFSEFVKKFRKQGKEEEEKFCELMIKLHYGKVSPSEKEINYLFNYLENIINGKVENNLKVGEEWRGSINKIKKLRQELEKIILKNKPWLIKLAGIKINSQKDLKRLLSTYPEEYKKLSSLYSNVKEMHHKFLKLLKEVEKKTDKKQRKELKNFLNQWKNEKIEDKNPFTQQMILLKMLKKYYSKLEIIISFRF
jgi:hypothetical protein